jgi:hypothetical protein
MNGYIYDSTKPIKQAVSGMNTLSVSPDAGKDLTAGGTILKYVDLNRQNRKTIIPET